MGCSVSALDPFACSYRLERSAQMLWSEDAKTWDLKAVFVVTVIEPGKRKPSLQLVGDSPPEAFRAVASWIDLGSPDKATIQAQEETEVQ